MAPSLRISAGPSVDSLSTVAVNHDDSPLSISTSNFQGRLTVRIKNFSGEQPSGASAQADSAYFNGGLGKGCSWSMQIQGRFLSPSPISSDDLVFGNEFDRPIKDHLPYGTGLALQFAKVIDPNLQHDLYAEKPWAFSPYIATMGRVATARLAADKAEGKDGFDGWPAFPSAESDTGPRYLDEDVTSLFYTADGKLDTAIEPDEDAVKNLRGGEAGIEKAHDYRKRWFGNKAHRQKCPVTSDQVVTADFFNGFIDFNDLTLHIPFSGGLSFDLKKYWDGQPVRYVCKDQKSGTVFFVIQFDITDLDQ
ncbi:uncharacterized protein PFL1_00951 [Pseudozyma flocculosa PF-1]|uniref:Domain of unknown function at the cortex 1 domain-containing protein n=1 Tax=Pseudozyma flocculosa TaxID=84751 RepID=A0A5C3F8K8_9BASI|nr:uncharacterized protein PFL1_00951 [Pseudozyma flocculosa PF-1]EPQ31618.1 hypothetical protein PFL1_00951 [Pseudozyma flocculosa PF-1]SPO40732.1 uncharacterized protein PSFLO_06214 [Pseudozyma flocculosa]